MAQGLKKLKQTGGKSKKHQVKRGKTGPKKGRIEIAPKKKKLADAKRLKKGMEKAINLNIEKEIAKKAKSVEAKSFSIFKPSESGSSASEKKKS